MFDNVGKKMGYLALGIVLATIVISILLFFYGIHHLTESKKYASETTSILSYGLSTYVGSFYIILSLITFIYGMIAAFLIDGFGQLILHTQSIDNNIKDLLLSKNNKDIVVENNGDNKESSINEVN